jgi:hypothetical protein
MLDAHPALAIPQQTHFIVRLLDLEPDDPQLRESFTKAIIGSPRWGDFHLDSEALKSRLESIKPFTIAQGLEVFYRMCADRRGKPRWGDKTPEYGHHMIRIRGLLPAARFIHIIRDGRDVACSLRNMWWDPSEDVEKHANVWVRSVTECRRQGASIPYYCEVHYETLVSEPEPILRRLCDFIELPYSPQMLEYHRTAAERMAELGDWTRPDGTVVGRRDERLRIHERTQLPPNSDHVGRWRSELTPAELASVQRVAGPLLTQLGYELAEVQSDLRPSKNQ